MFDRFPKPQKLNARTIERLAQLAAWSDRQSAPSASIETVPEWRIRENERIAREGRISPVWIEGGSTRAQDA